jgi:hypothetical protein
MNTEVLLTKLVEMAGGASGRGYILALRTDGIGSLPAHLDTGAGRYAVREVDTELGLRRTILRSQGAPFIAMVHPPLATRLPKDVVLRAQGGRIHGLEVIDILEIALGVPVVGTDNVALQQLAFEHIDGIKAEMEHRTRPTQIDRDLLDELLLDVCVGQRVRGARPGELLAAWLRQPPQWKPALADLVRRYLPKLHITEGSVLAWALAEPDRLRALLVHGMLLEVPGEVAPAVWGPLQAVLPGLASDERTVRAAVVGMARDAIAALGADAGAYLAAAENLGRQLLPPGMLARSSLLQLGLDDLLLELAKKAAAGQPVEATEVQAACGHRAFRVREKQVALVENLARLSRWLASPRRPCATIAEHVRGYQQSGAFADVSAARIVRSRGAVLDFSGQVDAVLAAYRSRRDEENRAFAEALAKDYTSALFRGGAVPLQSVWSDIVSRSPDALLRKGGKGGLFVAVLDGCSYPVFLELVGELARSAQPIGLSTADRPGEAARGHDVLSPLPTITSYARAALFLGKLPNDPARPDVPDTAPEPATDKARFAQNGVLGACSRKLFLKGDLDDGGQALVQAMAGPDDVVAAVFNAIDDQIGSSNTGARLSVRAEDIAAFVPAVQHALAAGRRVLLATDHGHTPFWNKDGRVGAGEAPRWRRLEGSAEAPMGFLEIPLDGLGNVQGRHAFAWKTGVYQGNPQVGFHGGCSLEEMVAPVAWLVRDGVAADEPSWWYGGTLPAPSRMPMIAAAPAPTVSAAPPLPTPVQAELLPIETASAAQVRALGLPEPVIASLDPSERAALLVLAQNLTVASGELGPRIGKATSRVAGFMVSLNRKLHERGLRCFTSSPHPSRAGEQVYEWIPPARRNA